VGTFSPVEAEFQLDKAGTVRALTLRAGDKRIPPRDAPKGQPSWRDQLRMIASSPTADADWTHVLKYDFD
jgi:hypothetical protein